MLKHMQWIKDNVSLLTETNEAIWDAKSVVGVDRGRSAIIWKSGGSHAYKTTGDGQRVPYKRKQKGTEEINAEPLTV